MGLLRRDITLLLLAFIAIGCASPGPRKSFFDMCEQGDIELVRKQLAREPSLVSRTEPGRGQTPLHFAGSREVAELLVDKGADVHAEGRLNWTPLHTARSGEIATYLIRKGADVHAEAQRKLTPIHVARNAEVAEVLIASGARVWVDKDPRSRRVTPLYWAIQNNRHDVVSVLVRHNSNLRERFNNGRTLLHFAAERGYVEIIDILIKRGISPNEQDKHKATPLHYAVLNDKVAAAAQLIEGGADVNARLSANTAVSTFRASRPPGPQPRRDTDVGRMTPLAVAASAEMKAMLERHGAV